MEKDIEYETYEDYLKSEEWKLKSEQRKIIDEYKCKICGSYEKLNVHHSSYKNINFNDGYYNENINNDLITLCEDCHKRIHSIANSLKDEKEKIINKFSEELNFAIRNSFLNYSNSMGKLVANSVFELSKNKNFENKNISTIIKHFINTSNIKNATMQSRSVMKVKSNENIHSIATQKLNELKGNIEDVLKVFNGKII